MKISETSQRPFRESFFCWKSERNAVKLSNAGQRNINVGNDRGKKVAQGPSSFCLAVECRAGEAT